MKVINLDQKFSLFQDQWSPKVVAELNGQEVKLAKVQGEFVWHDHEDEDELFFVVKGELTIEFRDRTEVIKAGEMIVVPRGVEHKPIAKEEVWIMLFEPAQIKHTGEVDHELTVKDYDKI
ncbi:MAG: cupin domain-containing protein [Bacteroidia bacterium]|nr:cupin domain-containing protein [Bacteroidia bacterium]